MRNKKFITKCLKTLFILIIGLNRVSAQITNAPYDNLNLDLVAPVGQLVIGNGANMINAPFADASYWHILSMRHQNPNNNFTTQIAGEFFGNRLAFRNTQSATNKNWNEIYHSGNINTLKEALANSGNISISNSSNEGGALFIENPLKTVNNTAFRWSIFNMTGSYGNSLQFWNYSQDNSMYGARFTLTDNGDVGIGTTTPKEKLSVNGKIRAHEVKVETANWPDYVFEPDYKVGTLEELESYIKANKHLPEVPSAKEVAANGVELGEMNKILLKKVEELTLHLIEKEKKMENLEKRLQKLEDKN